MIFLSGAMIVTTDEILTEFMAFFAVDPWLRQRAAVTVRRLLGDRQIRVVPQSREPFLDDLSLYEARPDKGYSLTDCISMQTTRGKR